MEVREARLFPSKLERAQSTICALALAVSFSTWFLVIRAPLWLDETVSLFLIQGGLKGILSRPVWPDSPIYSCLLLIWTTIFGTSEIMLRVSSLVPMFVAVYLLYRAARQLFPQDVAVLTAAIFCLHPIIIFAAVKFILPFLLGVQFERTINFEPNFKTQNIVITYK